MTAKIIQYCGSKYVLADIKPKRCPNGSAWMEEKSKCAKLSDPLWTEKDKYSDTRLHHAARHGIKEVLSHPDVAKVKNKYGDTPLHDAAGYGMNEVLEHPDVTKARNNEGKTPMNIAIRHIAVRNPYLGLY